jgi:hypothetical protein
LVSIEPQIDEAGCIAIIGWDASSQCVVGKVDIFQSLFGKERWMDGTVEMIVVDVDET